VNGDLPREIQGGGRGRECRTEEGVVMQEESGALAASVRYWAEEEGVRHVQRTYTVDN
jgi:hypothetical protein